MKVLTSTLAVLALFALPAEAQLRLQISNGRVTLDATNVPTQQILSEWARVGGTTIVGSEKIVGPPMTLRLVDMPEKQALDIILRNVAGFMAAPRQASAAPGASTYDRILIMATSSAPPPSTTSTVRGVSSRQGNQMNGVQRRVPPRPPNFPPAMADDPPMEDDQGNIVEEQPEPAAAEPPVFTFPTPNPAQGGNTVFVPMPGANGEISPGAVTAPVITLQPGTNGPTIYNFVPADGTGTPAQAPPGSFGVIGAPAPGMIQAPTPPPPTPATRVPPRPPGGN